MTFNYGYIYIGKELSLWQSILFCLIRFRFKSAWSIYNYNKKHKDDIRIRSHHEHPIELPTIVCQYDWDTKIKVIIKENKMATQAQITEEKKWQAENDARTLTEAEVIKNDGVRRKAAAIAARRMVKEKEKEASAMKRIAAPPIKTKKKVIKKTIVRKKKK